MCHLAVFYSASVPRGNDWLDHVLVEVRSDGTHNEMIFFLRTDFLTTCSLEMTYFPFDTQECDIDIGLHMQSTRTANLTLGM